MPDVFIATLGTEAQVVTLSLLELERLQFAIQTVVVIHTVSQEPRIMEALARLEAVFKEDERLRPYHFRFEPLRGKRDSIADITTAAEAEETFNEIFRVVRHYKLDNYRVHLNIAGGRKPMSIYGMVTAQMLFDDEDRLWYLVSNDTLVNSRRLWPQAGDEYQLVPVPLIRATDRPDRLWRLQNAQEALHEQEVQRRDMQYELFLAKLTASQRNVVKHIVKGLSNEQIASQLTNAESTIHKHISGIYAAWREQFGPIKRSAIRSTIVSELRAYFLRRDEDMD